MNARVTFIRRRWPIVATLLTLLIVALPIRAAVRVQRPITYDGGRINQEYLYGEYWQGHTHKGVDFSYGLGTNVYAVADGTVVDLYETYQNGQGTGFGNFVLIRHNWRHWDRTTQQNGYVYSIYAHLSHNSVRPSVGDPIQAGGSGAPTFERTGTTLYAPTMYGNQWGWDSTVEVVNTGSATANVQIQFKGRSGYGDTTRTYNISPNGRLEVAASSVWGGTSWVGSLVIQSTNGQPLAAVVHEHHTSQATRAYNASSAGSSTLYVPAAYKNKWGMTTGLVVQNVGSEPTTAYLDFYDRGGHYVTFVSLSNIGVGRAQGLWLGDEVALPDGWTGWVKVESSNGQPLAVYVNTVRPEGHYAYTGASQPGNTGILP